MKKCAFYHIKKFNNKKDMKSFQIIALLYLLQNSYTRNIKKYCKEYPNTQRITRMITKIDSKNPNPLLKLIEPIHTYHETNEIIFETYRPLLTIRHGIDHNERVQLSVYWNLKVGVVEFPKRSLLHPLLMICYHGRPRCFRFDRRETKAG